MIRVTPFRALITLLITYFLSPLPLQVGVYQHPRTIIKDHKASVKGYFVGGGGGGLAGFGLWFRV